MLRVTLKNSVRPIRPVDLLTYRFRQRGQALVRIRTHRESQMPQIQVPNRQ
jgi:hypothetical protein